MSTDYVKMVKSSKLWMSNKIIHSKWIANRILGWISNDRMVHNLGITRSLAKLYFQVIIWEIIQKLYFFDIVNSNIFSIKTSMMLTMNFSKIYKKNFFFSESDLSFLTNLGSLNLNSRSGFHVWDLIFFSSLVWIS